MSLEARIESLETTIVKLIDVIKTSGISAGATTTVAADTSAKGAAKTTAKTTTKTEPKTEPKAEPTPEPAAAEQKYTLEQLKAALQDYKQVFGIAEAKKFLPDMGYQNSNAVPADKIDEVYEKVQAAIAAKAEEEAGEL